MYITSLILASFSIPSDAKATIPPRQLYITSTLVTDFDLVNAATMTTAGATTISKRRKFVADGVFYAELNEFFQRELAEEGYSGVEVRVTPTVTDISATQIASKMGFNSDYLQSSVPHIHKKFLASKDGESANLRRSSRNASNFPKIPYHYMRPKSRTVVSLLSRNANPCVTNC